MHHTRHHSGHFVRILAARCTTLAYSPRRYSTTSQAFHVESQYERKKMKWKRVLLSAEFSQVKTPCKVKANFNAPRPPLNVEMLCNLGFALAGGRLIGRNFASEDTEHQFNIAYGGRGANSLMIQTIKRL